VKVTNEGYPNISSTGADYGSAEATQQGEDADMLPMTALSPLQRWRNSRPLAVSDFTSPAWCELQYFFSLSKYGYVKRTVQMQRGSEVHQKLEAEITEYTPVSVKTKEDRWGLRIWNVIQGLRSLRFMGMTRELDVWGLVDGQVVAGIIDELSIECPDPELQRKMEEKGLADVPLPKPRMTITEFFAHRSAQQKAKEQAAQEAPARIYITDTKTRQTATLPGAASLRPANIQLMLYHRLLTQLSTRQVPSAPIFAKYKLQPLAPFSEVFLTEMEAVEYNISAAQTAHFSSASSVQCELADHPNLELLWSLMIDEFSITFPPGSLSPLLHVSFRSQANGDLLGGRSFVHNENDLDSWLKDEMDWWKGVRPARGVSVYEAFKCRACEFADGCEWRKAREIDYSAKGMKGKARG
jgi:exonuclease V